MCATSAQEEWVVSNTTHFPLTPTDRQLAEMLVAAGDSRDVGKPGHDVRNVVVGTVVTLWYGNAPPARCTVESYLAGTGECPHNHCF